MRKTGLPKIIVIYEKFETLIKRKRNKNTKSAQQHFNHISQ